ncbi:MAG: bacillithiol system redox-active protein YtxJ [Capnocytophaga sp.]|nr:bacillithiol system redox-active protein YtxJ [Capnocytophaga sp.]
MRTVQDSYTQSDAAHFPWIPLTNSQQIEIIESESNQTPILIFKHSTRCGISRMVLRNFEREWNQTLQVSLYLLDLLANRDVSKQIARHFGVRHESPQALLLIKGKVVHYASHGDIDAERIASEIIKNGRDK